MATTVMLAHKFQEGKHNPVGWWMSEKLDGVRAYWTGSAFYSRAGNKFEAPAFFCADLPKTPLDGELWCGRGLFHKTMSIIKKLTPSALQQKEWEYVTYLVFDAPSLKEPYEKRVAWLQKSIDQTRKTTFAAVVGINKCETPEHLKKVLKEVLLKGGEGVMLRQPGSFYENRRSHTLLKVKFFQDEEAKVTGILPGTGRCSGMMGKLTCELPNGVTFKVGTGFSDAQRKNPPKVGSVITFKYQELSHHGNPRFPAFIRARDDMTWADVLKQAKIKIPFSQIKKPEYQLNKQHSILFSTIPSRDSGGSKVVTTDDEDEEVKIAASDGEDDEKPKKKVKGDDGGKKKPDDDGEPRPKKKCMYGSQCYRTNKAHLDAFFHENAKSSKVAAAPSTKQPAKVVVDLPTWTLDDDEGSDAEIVTKKKKHDQDSDEVEPKTKKVKKGSDDDEVKKKSADEDEPKKKVDEVKEKKPCMFGSKCFRRSPAHLAQYSHDKKPSDDSSENDDDEDARHTDDEEEPDNMVVPRREWEMLQATMTTLESMVKKGVAAQIDENFSGRDDGSGSCFNRARSASSSGFVGSDDGSGSCFNRARSTSSSGFVGSDDGSGNCFNKARSSSGFVGSDDGSGSCFNKARSSSSGGIVGSDDGSGSCFNKARSASSSFVNEPEEFAKPALPSGKLAPLRPNVAASSNSSTSGSTSSSSSGSSSCGHNRCSSSGSSCSGNNGSHGNGMENRGSIDRPSTRLTSTSSFNNEKPQLASTGASNSTNHLQRSQLTTAASRLQSRPLVSCEMDTQATQPYAPGTSFEPTPTTSIKMSVHPPRANADIRSSTGSKIPELKLRPDKSDLVPKTSLSVATPALASNLKPDNTKLNSEKLASKPEPVPATQDTLESLYEKLIYGSQ